MLQGTSNRCGPKECVLKCKEATHFFDFPSEDIFRNLWLYVLGMEHLDRTVWVCDRHFSENMLSSSGTKLEELAVPDQNLPDTLVKRNEIYDQLIKKITIPKTPERRAERKVIPAQDKLVSAPRTTVENPEPTNSLPVQPITNTPAKNLSTNVTPKESVISFPAENLSSSSITATNVTPTSQPSTNFPDWLDDSSNLLMDYQLRFQGKHMCDVIEMPEYIVVFTVFKAKELKTGPGAQSKSKENVNPLLSIPSSITVSQTIPKKLNAQRGIIEIDDNDEVIDNRIPAQIDQNPEIDYVYYMTEEAIPRREREVQVDIPNDTTESAIQCDVELDSDMMQMGYSSQLHQMEPHVSTVQTKDECLICGEIVASYASKMKHALEHKKMQSLCPHCGEVFSNKLKLNAHERNVHSENGLEIKKALRCPKLNCKKAFHSIKQLNNHIDEHMRYAEHKCNKCLRLFPSALKLHGHQNAYKNCLKSRWSKARRWGRSK